MVKMDADDVTRPFARADTPGSDAIAERLLAVGFLAALGIWMALAFALGSS